MNALCAVLGAPLLQSPPRTAAGANKMDEEQKNWRQQYTSNIGVREVLRLGFAFVIWILILIVLSIPFGFAGYSSSSISWIFSTILVITILAFPFIAFSWKPAYSLLRKILGNKNLPTEPRPHSIVKIPRRPLPWWGYLFGIWFLLLDLLILYIILKRH